MPAGSGNLVVLRYGARAVPFDEAGRPLLWLNPKVGPLRSEPQIPGRPLIDDWNFGAERLWLGPEYRLMVGDRNDFAGTYEMPSAIDPGTWAVTVDPGAGTDGVALAQELDLIARDTGERVGLSVEQRLAVAADPTRRWPEPHRLSHLGWTREVRLARAAGDDGTVPVQSWVITQVESGGTVTVPGAAAARVTDYFEPIDDRHVWRQGEDLRVSLSGASRFKIGVRTGEHRGAATYRQELAGGRARLYVRRFLDLPSTRYLEQPPELVDHEGDSLYFYHDTFGAFGELEALGRALETYDSSHTDLFEFHVWWGASEHVDEIERKLLGS